MTVGPRLLIVDDDLEFLEILVGRFHRRGFAVTAHTTCQQALEAAKKQAFVAAMVDRSVPGGEDLELVGRLASIDTELPVVVLSGWSGPQYIEEALAAGAREYLVKPCALADIEAAVRRAIDSRAANPPVDEGAE
jgi:ActR/RegA family two-component response regulator